MSKVCKIYYGTVISEDGNGWAHKGSHTKEPIRVEGREPFGKSPDYCCKDFEAQFSGDYIEAFAFYPGFDGEKPSIRLEHWQGNSGTIGKANLNFCPFCGARILMVEHLKLRVVATPITRNTYHYEPA